MNSIRPRQENAHSPEENIVRRQFKRSPVLLFIGAIGSATTFLSCTHDLQPVRASMQPLPPLSGRLRIATTIVPRSQRFKVAVLTFIDQTGRAQLVVDPIADMLTTELFAVKRFELYDRQDLIEQTHAREVAENQNVAQAVAASANATDGKKVQIQESATRGAVDQKTASQYRKVEGKVDGVLLGYITSFKINDSTPVAPETRRGATPAPAPADRTRPKRDTTKGDVSSTPLMPASAPSDGSGTFDIDFRIVNTLAADRAADGADRGAGGRLDPNLVGMKELVVFGDSAKVRFHMTGGNIELDRQDVSRIAEEIKKKFPEFSKQPIKVTSLQDRVVSLNVGEQDGVKQGFTGYVIEKDENTKVYRYLAEFVLINVFPSAATALVVSDDRDSLPNILANIKVGSEAVIK
jgi:Fe-S-cluster formation regulator IscX/YfhJ